MKEYSKELYKYYIPDNPYKERTFREFKSFEFTTPLPDINIIEQSILNFVLNDSNIWKTYE